MHTAIDAMLVRFEAAKGGIMEISDPLQNMTLEAVGTAAFGCDLPTVAVIYRSAMSLCLQMTPVAGSGITTLLCTRRVSFKAQGQEQSPLAEACKFVMSPPKKRGLLQVLMFLLPDLL